MDPLEVNLRWWDEAAVDHFDRTYDLDRFRTTLDSLLPIEAAEIGDVTGMRVCHLQCHIGPDTLSLAARGAEVVGVDFSPEAIRLATQLAEEVRLADRSTFVRSTVEDARATVDGDFDLVFTTWGTLGWLPDIDAWAGTVASLLRPGGSLYLAEIHPYPGATDHRDGALAQIQPYSGGEVVRWEEPGDYSDREAVRTNTVTYWHCYGLGEIVTAIIDAGLRLDWLHEHDGAPCDIFMGAMPRGDDGLYRLPGSTLPLSFSLRATSSGSR